MSEYHDLLDDVTFHRGLVQLDEMLAAKARMKGDPGGGRLHRADYPRKPAGVPRRFAHLHSHRTSYCSDLDGARRRLTPPSVRFLGRRVYLFAVFLLASVLRNDVNRLRAAQLKGLLDVSEETLRRWRRWWIETFPTTAVWQELRGRFVPPIASTDLPRSLLDRSMIDSVTERVLKLLELLSPLSVEVSAKGC